MKVFLIRHGQTEWNEKEIFRGRVDIPLDPTGKVQAEAVAERLSAVNIKKIYTSPLKRASETAEIIGAKFNLTPETAQDLIEFDCGVWQGLSLDKVQKDFPELYKKWVDEPRKVKIPNGETLEQIRARVNRFIEAILKKPAIDTAIVTHRIIIKIITCLLLSLDNSYFWRIRQDLASFTTFQYENGLFTLTGLNDCCHLKSGVIAASKDF